MKADRRALPPRHVAITGAAGAIGGAIARAMRHAWPGAALALIDREVAPMSELASELGDATVHAADLTDVEALPGLVERIAAHAPLDGLVNCAGIMRVRQVATWAWEDAEALLAVDLVAPLRLQALIVPGMTARDGGIVVNVASMAGHVALRGCAYYGAAKAGLAMASEVARADLARHGVRVVTVYPGPVRSALERGARADYGGGGWIGRLAPTGEPARLAALVMRAIERDEPRVIYPRAYGLGWNAPNVSRWLALTLGPPPVQ